MTLDKLERALLALETALVALETALAEAQATQTEQVEMMAELVRQHSTELEKARAEEREYAINKISCINPKFFNYSNVVETIRAMKDV